MGSFEDSPFTIEMRFKDSYNSGLANGLGNLSSRILTLSEKYLEKCPEIPEHLIPQEFFDYLEQFDMGMATGYVWQRIQNLCIKFQDTEPFKVIKVDEEKGKEMIKELVLDCTQ